MPTKRINRPIVRSNVAEALEQLQDIVNDIDSRNKITESDLRTYLIHAYHHLNFAWNVRFVPTDRYAHMTGEDFDAWRAYPKYIEETE